MLCGTILIALLHLDSLPENECQRECASSSVQCLSCSTPNNTHIATCRQISSPSYCMYYKRLSQAETNGQDGRSPQVVIAASELHALRLTEAAGAMAEVNSGRWLRRRGFFLTVAIIISSSFSSFCWRATRSTWFSRGWRGRHAAAERGENRRSLAGGRRDLARLSKILESFWGIAAIEAFFFSFYSSLPRLPSLFVFPLSSTAAEELYL